MALFGEGAVCPKCGAGWNALPQVPPARRAQHLPRLPDPIADEPVRTSSRRPPVVLVLALLSFLALGSVGTVLYTGRIQQSRVDQDRVEQDRIANYFPLSQGRTWVYQDQKTHQFYEARITGMDEFQGRPYATVELYRGTSEDGNKLGQFYLEEGNGCIILRGFDTNSGTRFRSDLNLVSFPLHKRDWTGAVKTDLSDPGWHVNFHVVSETCGQTVPAGSYSCLHVEARVQDHEPLHVQYWEGPGVGPVRFELAGNLQPMGLEPGVLELVSFSRDPRQN
ncbi:MAG TPA: hypothetical protein VGO93_23765 [Candidatus Xenobia bacterium]